MGNLLSAHTSRPRPPSFILRTLGPSFVTPPGEEGGGSGGGGSQTGKKMFNPYLKSSTTTPPAAATANAAAAAATNDGGEESARSFDGRAVSTRKGHEGSVRKWNMFADKHKYPQFDALTETDVCGKVLVNGSMMHQNNPPIHKLMREFAQFLIDYKKNPDEDEEAEEGGTDEVGMLFSSTCREEYKGLSPGSILGHFTRIKSRLFTKFKALGFKGDMPDWYSNLHRSLKNRVITACIARGCTVTKKTVGIGRKALSNMCEHFFGLNTSMGYEKRCVLVVVFHAVGRGGEIAFTQWDGVRWDVDREHLVIDWGEVKKGNQYLLTFHPDATNWRIDVLHAIACYVLCGNGEYKASTTHQESGVNWMFPGYVDMAEGGAASKISRIVDEAKEAGVNFLLPDSTSHGLRVGATDEMVYHFLLSVFAACARGGWDCKGDSMLFHYMTADSQIAEAGKALANWHDPKMHVSAPTLEAFVTAENQAIVEAFCQELFGTCLIPNINNEMKCVRDVLVASLLRFYEDVMKDNRESMVIRKIQAAAIRCKINLQQLREWGQLVKNDFLVKNAQNLGNNGGSDSQRLSSALTILQESCATTSAQLVRVEASVRDLSQKQDDTLALLQKILKNQEHMMSWMDTSDLVPSDASPLKRKLSSMGSPTESAAAEATSATTKKAKNDVVNGIAEIGKPKPEVDWRSCAEWSCAKLVEEIVKSNMNVDSDHFIPAHKSEAKKVKDRLRKLRMNARKVFKELLNLAEGEQKNYFDWKNLPPETDLNGERTTWLQGLTKTVGDLAIAMTKNFVRRILQAQGTLTEERFRKKFKNTKLSISTLAGLISDTTCEENKVKDNS